MFQIFVCIVTDSPLKIFSVQPKVCIYKDFGCPYRERNDCQTSACLNLCHAHVIRHMSRNMRKPTFWFQTRSDTNRAAQPLELIRGLKFHNKEVEGLY